MKAFVFLSTIFVLMAAEAVFSAEPAVTANDGIAINELSQRANSCAQPPNGTMVAWYNFEVTPGFGESGDSAMGNVGNLYPTNNPPVPVAGMVGRALSFNGIDQYVEAPSTIVTNFGPALSPSVCLGIGQGDYSACTGDFSIDTWINVPAGFSPTYAPPIAVKTAVVYVGYNFVRFAGYGFRLQSSLNGIELVLEDGQRANIYFSPVLSPPLPGTGWHHVAVTVQRLSRQGITWYYDGHCLGFPGVCVTGDPTDVTGSLANNGPLEIGKTAIFAFKGDLDELDIYNRVLTPNEVLSIYNAGSAGKCYF